MQIKSGDSRGQMKNRVNKKKNVFATYVDGVSYVIRNISCLRLRSEISLFRKIVSRFPNFHRSQKREVGKCVPYIIWTTRLTTRSLTLTKLKPINEKICILMGDFTNWQL